jgi:hypothetical protein
MGLEGLRDCRFLPLQSDLRIKLTLTMDKRTIFHPRNQTALNLLETVNIAVRNRNTLNTPLPRVVLSHVCQ